MRRKKVKLAYITNNTARRVSYKKRKQGLFKKLSELTILCDVEACALISSQYDPHPEAWPSLMEAQAIIDKFKNMPECDQSIRMMNQEAFIRSRIEKAQNQLKTKQAEIKNKMMKQLMFDLMNGYEVPPSMTMADMQNLGSFVESYMHEVCARMDYLRTVEEQNNAVAVQVDMEGDRAMQASVDQPLPDQVPNVNKDSEEAMQSQKWIEQMMSPPLPCGPSGKVGFDEDEDIVLPPFDDQNGFWSVPFLP